MRENRLNQRFGAQSRRFYPQKHHFGVFESNTVRRTRLKSKIWASFFNTT
jgi:hypothetical protein